jgi:hypothetical protein
VANLNPQTNPGVAYFDAALTIVAPQPLRTINGYVSRAGTPAQIYVDAVNFSILVQDSNGTMVYNFPDGTGISSDACGVIYNPPFTNAVPYPVCEKLEQTVSVKDFGAVGDGVNDDTVAIQAAVNASTNVWFGSGDWKITATIQIPAGRFLDFGPGNINANCPGSPIFAFGNSLGGTEGLSIFACGGLVTGTAESFLKMEGSSNFGISPANYARQIRIEGIHVSGGGINKFMHMVTAVRQVFVSKCLSFSVNGVLADGKHVEVMFDKCVIFGSTGAAGTFGMKLLSNLGTSRYNEGWTISDSTIDNFEYVYDIADVFVFEVDNGYYGRDIIIRRPITTTHTREIVFNGNVFGTDMNIVFASSANGLLTNAIISDNIFVGGGVQIGGNHTGISVRGNKFESSTLGAVAVTIADNCNNITCECLDIDATYIGGVIMSGTNGDEITVRNISYAGTGNSLFSSRPVLVNNLDMGDGSAINEKQVIDFVVGVHPAGTAMGAVTASVAKGQTGKIMGVVSATGLDAGITLGVPNQRFDINAPASIVFPSIVGNSAKFIYPLAASGTFAFSIPFHCTADTPAALIELVNATGNSANVQFHSWFGLVRD